MLNPSFVTLRCADSHPRKAIRMKASGTLRMLALLVTLVLLTTSAGYAQQPGTPDPPDACDLQPPTITGAGVIVGTDGDDVIHGSDGDDSIDGGGGNDVLCGGLGNDTINGGDGNDFIKGQDGDDDLGGGDDNDTLSGGPGTDMCDGADGKTDVADATCEQLDDIP